MTVYTETVIHLAPGAYQVAIVMLDDGGRITARIEGERVSIGDTVAPAGEIDGVPWFRKA
jgi:uncharacterized OB-fold protein